MDERNQKRCTAQEAAAILGIPAHQISRLDPLGEIIRRYKLTRKTHVYDVESLYRFLESRRVAPIERPKLSVARSRAVNVDSWRPEGEPVHRQPLIELVRGAAKRK